MGHSKSSSKREFYSNKCLHLEKRKLSNNLILHLEESEEEQTKSKVNRRKEIIKIRAEIKQRLERP